MSFDSDKILDAWMAPQHSGTPVACVTTSFMFEPGFFDEECLARFLGLDAAVVTGGDETDTLVYVLEREQRLEEGVRASVLVDRSYAQAAASFRWDVIPVSAGRGGVQHAKVSLLLWEKRMRLVVASANLTQPGYRSNIEVFSVLDDTDESVPNDLFEDAVQFLRLMIGRHTRGESSEDSPRGRARATLALAHSRIRTRVQASRRGGPTVRFLHTLRDEDLLQQGFEEVWKDGARPSYYVVTSPYFDCDASASVSAIAQRLSTRGNVVGEVGVIVKEAGSDQVKVDAPESLGSLEFRGAPELYAWPSQDQDDRLLHAKTFLFGNDRRVMMIAGSANATSAGLGIGDARNIEAVIAISDRADSEAADQLTDVVPELGELPEGTLVFDAPVAEEEERPSTLPGAFVEALYHPAENVVIVALELSQLPSSWLIRRGDEIWFAAEDLPTPLKRRELRKELLDATAPRSLTVEWDSDDGKERYTAELVVAVADAASLPDPPEIQALTLEELLDLLAVGGRLHDLLRRLVARRLQQNGQTVVVPPELDPHRRVDTSQFMLQRTHRVAYALEGLKRKLSAPISNADALERRLRGPFGATGLKEAADRAVAEGSMSPRERSFMLAELALVISRAEWKPVGGALSLRRCRAAARSVLDTIRPEPSEDVALNAYVAAAFREAGR